ncbi:hypothetical protein GQ44DRAFT_784412 [Phaeosphaeriaceae sp. PMI808]|nr:hypothetical protein GQ44DRAFT_784412 [Phaeosphaeriaceae sp. PMI808]
MAEIHNYAHTLAGEFQDQEIAEEDDKEHQTQLIFRPLDSNVTLRPLVLSDYSWLDQHEVTERSSLKSRTNFSNLKSLGARFRGKPLPRSLKGSERKHAAANIEPARIERGVWKDQLLSDRSLRGMAALMTAFASGLIILVISYSKSFKDRANLNSTSVGGQTESCKKVAQTNTALLLLINTCATMVLGMSNTYQQLVTSLKINDLKYALSKFGDSRVGTNSPFSIQHKRKGKIQAWAAWFLLILTSMPVHFLANSLIGPSYTQKLPKLVEFNAVNNASLGNTAGVEEYLPDLGYTDINPSPPFLCWSTFLTGTPHFIKRTNIFASDSKLFGLSPNLIRGELPNYWEKMIVHYLAKNCSQYVKSATESYLDTLENQYDLNHKKFRPQEANCVNYDEVFCTLHDPQNAECRLSVRMSAAFILMGCLVIKAIYMCAVNILARGKVKEHCLTFGDVIVASASQTKLRVQGFVKGQTIILSLY